MNRLHALVLSSYHCAHPSQTDKSQSPDQTLSKCTFEFGSAVCCRGKELFPTKFVEFLTSKPGEDEDKKKKALIAELQSVNDHLEKSGKPYFGGDDVCATDLSMAPKIKHIKIGADEVKVRFDCLHVIEH